MRKTSGILTTIKHSLQRQRLGELLVLQGKISPRELRLSLREQKRTKKPLGQIFLEKAVISRRQLVFILGRQYLLRACATCLFIAASTNLAASKKAHAERISDVPAKLTLSSMASEFTRVSAYPAIYGTIEKKSTNLSAFTKWSGMFERFEKDLTQQASIKVIQDWQSDLKQIKRGSIKNMAEDVNKLVNKTRYITDIKNWGKSDYWATPAEFLQRGGDCEDYAIAKYTALRALGVPEERLRVAIVQDTYKNIPHAVLIVYTENGAYLLDNQNKNMISASFGDRYKPIFSINRQAWWLHNQPDTSTVVASAVR
ncbi:MAG: hypothetical protein CMH26_01120 [Micavibrio sp.]|nr:hypothetical protein [Micavibrio sp.]|tara:strand:+ start:1727 stop:2665 length:939 start_codon:yes stop_codon:yes gene_type:complete